MYTIQIQSENLCPRTKKIIPINRKRHTDQALLQMGPNNNFSLISPALCHLSLMDKNNLLFGSIPCNFKAVDTIVNYSE